MTDDNAVQEAESSAVVPTPGELLAGDLIIEFTATLDAADKWGQSVIVNAERICDVLTWLRDERGFTMLLDIIGVDYLSYPGHRDERFAVVYLLKNIETSERVRVKVFADEEEPVVPTACGIFKNANWAEREVFDQVGVTFSGHPNLKRILNHHEFVGHPLRKDYPAQKRQHLSINDSMVDELVQDLEGSGYSIVTMPTAEEAAQAIPSANQAAARRQLKERAHEGQRRAWRSPRFNDRKPRSFASGHPRYAAYFRGT